MSRFIPRSKTRFVILRFPSGEGDGCWMRNEREGTVVRTVGDVSVMNKYSGRVRWPASRAEMVTYFWSADAVGSRSPVGDRRLLDEQDGQGGGLR